MFGVLPIHKPQGLTSRDVVTRVARLIKPVKVGHTGTLDPLATGVLLLAVGPATRLTEFSHESRKRYRGTFELGKRSDTLDSEGEVQSLDAPPTIDRVSIENLLPKWMGRVTQTPPRYSAIHINGQRAYELARAGKEFEVPQREVVIDSLRVLHFDYPMFELDIECGTGTYIRTLGSDIALSLGSDAIMTQLVRTQIGPVDLNACCELDALQTKDEVQRRLLPPEVLLAERPRLELSAAHCAQIRNGIPIETHELEPYAWEAAETETMYAAFSPAGQLVAVLRTEDQKLRSVRVFQR